MHPNQGTDIMGHSITSEDNGLIPKGIIYLISHSSIPELKYIGQTTKTLSYRWACHLSKSKQFDKMYQRVYLLMNYYGIDNFTIRELEMYRNVSQMHLDSEEKRYITECGTMNTMYANEAITIKITDGMKNLMIKKLIQDKTDLPRIYKLIHPFQYNSRGDKLDFVVDDENQELLDDMLSCDLRSRLIGMEIRTTDDVMDKKGNSSCYCVKLTEDMLDDEMVLDDFMEYISFFHKHFQVTDRVEDTYYSCDLVYGMQTYGENNSLFDFYFHRDFAKIMQTYFDIINASYTNVDINLSNTKIFGIKKHQPITFELFDEIQSTVISFLEEVDSTKDFDIVDFIYSRKCNKNTKGFLWKSCNDVLEHCSENKMEIETLSEGIYTIWDALNSRRFKRDYSNKNSHLVDEENRIMEDIPYSYDWHNMDYIHKNLRMLLDTMIERDSFFKIVDDKYIMLDEY